VFIVDGIKEYQVVAGRKQYLRPPVKWRGDEGGDLKERKEERRRKRGYWRSRSTDRVSVGINDYSSCFPTSLQAL